MSEKIKILVIEDDITQSILIEEALNSSIYEITNIPDGLEALDFLLTNPDKPDLILMDYHLPNIDGLSIMNKLKEHDKKFNIIFLTADYSIETAIKSINSGALEFIPKDGRFVTNIPTIIDKAYQTVKAKIEREQFEIAYRQSEERFRMVLEASKDGIFEWNSSTNEIHFSPNNAQMLDYKLDEFPRSYDEFLNLIHPDDICLLDSSMREHIDKKSPLYEVEIRMRTREGRYKWILERGIIVEKDNAGRPLRTIGTHADISERKASEELVLRSNKRLTTLIGNLPGVVYRYKVNNNITREFIGGRVEEITGYHPNELLQTPNDFLVHPNDKSAYNETIQTAISKNAEFEVYYQIINKNNETRWIWDHGKAMKGNDGQPDTLEGYFADVTEKKTNDEALRQSEEERNTILDNSLQAFILLNPQGQIISFNKVANHRNILRNGKSLKKNNLLVDYFSNEQRQLIQSNFDKVIRGEPIYWEQPEDIRGELSWYENVMVPVLISREEIRYVCFTSSDITERKIAEDKIVYSENLLNTTINSLNDLLVVVDEDLKILLTNEAFLQFNKINHFEMHPVGKNITKVCTYLTTSILDTYREVFKNGEISIQEYSLTQANRPTINEIKLTPVFQQKKVVRVVTTIRDITERKNFEKRIMNAIIETEERERKRFSEDLHDEMGAVLSTIKIYINTIHSQQIDDEKKLELIEMTNHLIDQAITNSKEIANNLSPNIIIRFGLISALQSFCDKIQLSKDIVIHFGASKYNHQLKEDEEISIYRIVIELINNTLKHAQADEINIEFRSFGKKLEIDYFDNGKGFDFAKTVQNRTTGLGLHNILSRISSLNGTFQSVSNSENGFGLKIEMDFNFDEK
jgi:PAS domain S-box-containing protein